MIVSNPRANGSEGSLSLCPSQTSALCSFSYSSVQIGLRKETSQISDNVSLDVASHYRNYELDCNIRYLGAIAQVKCAEVNQTLRQVGHSNVCDLAHNKNQNKI